MHMKNVDEHYLRIAFKEAVRARVRGNHAFGALLADGSHRAHAGRRS